jgi:hypothetical protein
VDACRFKKVAQDEGEDLVCVQARLEEDMEPSLCNGDSLVRVAGR